MNRKEINTYPIEGIYRSKPLIIRVARQVGKTGDERIGRLEYPNVLI